MTHNGAIINRITICEPIYSAGPINCIKLVVVDMNRDTSDNIQPSMENHR